MYWNEGNPVLGEVREEKVELSVVIAVRDPDRAAPIQQLYGTYKRQVEQTGLQYEFVFVVEGNASAIVDALCQLKEEGEPIKILTFARWYGDATALTAGFQRASGAVLVTLPAHPQVEPEAIPQLVEALDEESDMVVARRIPWADRTLTQVQVRIFHAVLRRLLGFEFHDLGCSVRVFRREVVETVRIYGNQHRFLPVLASHYGFAVKEMKAPQTKSDALQNRLSPRVYVNRLLDLLSIFFLAKFTKQPLRFFGFSGVFVFSAGFALTLFLTVQRLFMGVPLADKPMLLLGVLLIVMGTLFVAIGLIGEMIIFTHAKDFEEYTVEEIIN